MRISDWSSDVCSSDLPRQAIILDLQPFGIGYFGDRKREIFHTKEGERQIVAVVTTAAGKTLHFGAAIAKSTGDPECVAEMRGHLAEPGDLLLIGIRSEEYTSELQSLMRISYAVFCLKKKNTKLHYRHITQESNPN